MYHTIVHNGATWLIVSGEIISAHGFCNRRSLLRSCSVTSCSILLSHSTVFCYAPHHSAPAASIFGLLCSDICSTRPRREGGQVGQAARSHCRIVVCVRRPNALLAGRNYQHEHIKYRLRRAKDDQNPTTEMSGRTAGLLCGKLPSRKLSKCSWYQLNSECHFDIVTLKHTHLRIILACQNVLKLTYSNLEFPNFSGGRPGTLHFPQKA